jgi:hypothetical protein
VGCIGGCVHILFQMEHCLQLGRLGFDVVSELRPKSKSDTGAKYKEDHMVLFERCGMQWPCVLDPVQTHDGYTCFFGAMTVRQLEMTILLHITYSAEHDVEFLDVNPSLNQLTGFKQGDAGLRPNSVWKPVPGTLVGSSFMLVRCRDACIVRPLLGCEYMQLIGWATSEWVTSRPFSPTAPMPSHALCAELAGNAFSAFVMSPLVATLIACSGAMHQLRDDAEESKLRSKARTLTSQLSCSSIGGSSMEGDF